jgi:glycoside/pentoside/hexuronide:cation symporter, GPH family
VHKWREWVRVDTGKLGWVAGEFSLASYAGVSTIYLLFYATEVLRIPPAAAGFALLIPRIWNIVFDPIVGVLSDRANTRFGRRRPFLLAGTIIWAFAFCLLFNQPRMDNTLIGSVLFASVFLLNNTGLTLFQVPYAAMLAEFTSEAGERTRLVAYREVAARVAILLTLAFAPFVLASASSKSGGFGLLGIVFGLVILASGLGAFFATEASPATVPAKANAHWALNIAPIIDNRPFRLVTISYLFINLGDAVFSGSLVYYITETLHRSAALIGTLYPVSSITGIVCTPLWTLAAKRWGRTRMCRWTLGLLSLCCLLPLLVPVDQVWLLYPFMCLYGAFNTGARLLPNAMVPDTVDLDYRRTGEHREGLFFGIFVFIQQTGFAAGGFVLSLLLTFGRSPVAQTDKGVTAILICFTVATAILYGASFLALIGYRLDDDR